MVRVEVPVRGVNCLENTMSRTSRLGSYDSGFPGSDIFAFRSLQIYLVCSEEIESEDMTLTMPYR